MRIRRVVCAGLIVAGALTLPALRGQSSDTRLIEAVRRRDEKVFATLMRAKADVNATQADGTTVLAWAVHLGQRGMADVSMAYAGSKTVLRRDLFPTRQPLRARRISARAGAHCGSLEERPRAYRRIEREGDGAASRAGCRDREPPVVGR